MHKIKLVWLKAYEEYPPNLHGALESFAQAKTATAHFLRQETRSKRESTSTIRALEKELDTHIFLLGDSPTQAALTTRERLLPKIKEAKPLRKGQHIRPINHRNTKKECPKNSFKISKSLQPEIASSHYT
jgi:hypothetical protein